MERPRGTGQEGAFGALLRGLREVAGLTQQELAERSGLSTKGISALERGERRRPYPHTLRALASALDLSDPDRAALFRSARRLGSRADDTPRHRPAQLPPDTPDFTGRHEEAASIVLLLGSNQEGSTKLCAIAGKPGVGKSALAIHIAHRLKPDFPDGQLYADLRGADREPASANSVLSLFLLALGVSPETLPGDLAGQSAVYRSLLAATRALIVLDNARNEAQVRPLIPGGSSCGVLITSRLRLAALAGAELLELEDLDPEDALALMSRIAGQARVKREPAAAATIGQLCGGLPLALRIAGATLKVKRHWPLVKLVDRLSDERRRLDELRVGDLDVRASVALSYANLPEADARVFRLLGLLPGPDFSVELVAAVAGSELASAERTLEELHTAQLLLAGENDRYRLHDLLRLFARDRLEQEEPATTRRGALARALEWYESMADEAASILRRAGERGEPPAATAHNAPIQAALARFERELPSLVPAVARAYELERFDLCLRLADALEPFFVIQEAHSSEQERVQETALAAARRLGDRASQGRALHSLGEVQRNRGSWDAAIDCYAQALAIFLQLRDRRGEAAALLELGRTYRKQGRWLQAGAHQELSLAIFRLLGDRRGEGRALNGLGLLYNYLGRSQAAVACYEQSLVILRQLGDRHFEGWVLVNLGGLHRIEGRLEEAIVCAEASLEIFRQLRDRDCETWALRLQGGVYRQQERWPEALECFKHSLNACEKHGDREGEAKSYADMGRVRCEQGRFEEATACLERSLSIFRLLGDRHGESAALNQLGEVHLERDQIEDAVAFHEQSLAICRALGDRRGQAEGAANLGKACRRQRQWEEAIAWHQRSLDIYRGLGDRCGESGALEQLGEVLRQRGDFDSALVRHQQSLGVRRLVEDRQGEARSLTSLGDVWRDQGQLEEAIAAYEESLTIYDHLEGSRAGEAIALIRLAGALRLGGRWEEAAACYERGLGVARKLGDRIREAEALTGRGLLEAGRPSGEPGITTYIGRRKDPRQNEAQ